MTLDRTRMFRELDIETSSSCNRVCPTCLRQSGQPKSKLTSWMGKQTYLPTETIFSILDQAKEMGYTGQVNLQHLNEPLLDRRIGIIADYARSLDQFYPITMYSNFDALTPIRAKRIDGKFDMVIVALYDDDSAENRARLQAMVPNTKIAWTGGGHIVTHFSPRTAELDHYINISKGQSCIRHVQHRCIISHTGRMLLCCDDIGYFPELGSIHEKSLRELWYGDAHMDILEKLSEAGGRLNFPYCRICPRMDEPNDD